MTENTVSILNMLDYIPSCKGSYLASGRAGLFGGQNLNWSLEMGPLAHDESKISFVIEFLFGELIFFGVLNFTEEEICHCFEAMDNTELFLNAF